MESKRSSGGTSSKKRLWTILGTVAFVIFLAGVIFWGSALSSPDSDSAQIDSNLTAEQESDELYRQALAALQSGETTEAATLLKKAVALDPNGQPSKPLTASGNTVTLRTEDHTLWALLTR